MSSTRLFCVFRLLVGLWVVQCYPSKTKEQLGLDRIEMIAKEILKRLDTSDDKLYPPPHTIQEVNKVDIPKIAIDEMYDELFANVNKLLKMVNKPNIEKSHEKRLFSDKGAQLMHDLSSDEQLRSFLDNSVTKEAPPGLHRDIMNVKQVQDSAYLKNSLADGHTQDDTMNLLYSENNNADFIGNNGKLTSYTGYPETISAEQNSPGLHEQEKKKTYHEELVNNSFKHLDTSVLQTIANYLKNTLNMDNASKPLEKKDLNPDQRSNGARIPPGLHGQ